MLKKISLSLTILLVCMILFASCSSTYSEAPAMEDPAYDVPADEYAPEEATTVEVTADETDRADKAQFETKIVRNADVSLEVLSVEEAYRKILDWVRKNDGYESSRNMDTVGGITEITATIKIKAENLDALLTHIESVGTVITSEIVSDEVTDQYYDLETRIQTMRATLDKYYEFLEATKTVDEMLKVQRSIDELTVDIESLEGQLRLLKSKVSESSVSLRLWEKPTPVVEEEEIVWTALSFSDMLTLTGRMFSKVGNFLVSFLQWIVIYSPILLLLAILWIAIRLFVRRYRKKHPKPVRPVYGPGMHVASVPPVVPPVHSAPHAAKPIPNTPSEKESNANKADS